MAWTNPKTWSVGEVLTAALLNTHLRDNLDVVLPDGGTTQTYTPVLSAVTTDPTLGSGSSQTGRYFQVGNVVHVWADVEFGSSGVSAGSGRYRLSVPVAMDTTPDRRTVGSVYLVDDSSGAREVGVAVFQDASNVELHVSGANATASRVSGSVPWTWAAGDIIAVQLTYEA